MFHLTLLKSAGMTDLARPVACACRGRAGELNLSPLDSVQLKMAVIERGTVVLVIPTSNRASAERAGCGETKPWNFPLDYGLIRSRDGKFPKIRGREWYPLSHR
ncbi:hypothetical protein RRG08_044713 [Elysia crispata]|uniref:Uncharacterized protein n=1 Tax=Elysia crispata TaxID=231223 RepID=A0AAE0XX07_9GAST|nr:hypothetical protein RRG08_044713 [Elysia crispata]